MRRIETPGIGIIVRLIRLYAGVIRKLYNPLPNMKRIILTLLGITLYLAIVEQSFASQLRFLGYDGICIPVGFSSLTLIDVIGMSLESVNRPYSDLNPIADSLKIIANNSGAPKWWDLFLYFGSAGLGGLIAVLAQYFFQKQAYTKEKAKIRKDQLSKINAALVSFNCMVDTLSLLKNQFIEPYKNEIKIIKEAEDQNIENIWYGLKKFKEYYANQAFDETIYTEDLAFIGLDYPSHLITFHKYREHMLQINPTIEERNNFLQREQWQFQHTRRFDIEELKDMIAMHASTCRKLEHFVNETWLLLLCAIEHLEEYAGKNFEKKPTYKHAIPRESELDEESKKFKDVYMAKITDTQNKQPSEIV